MQIANSLPRKLNAVADMIPYDNTDSNLKSTNIQDAIDELDNENDVLHDCSTARNTIAKVVAYDGFVLKKGARIYVRFTDTGTANPTSGNPTLNVNNTGAKNIVDGKSNKTVLTYSSCGWFYNNMVHEFIYDGTYWVWMTRDNNTTYTGATLKTGAAKTGSGTTVTDTIAKSTTMDNAIQTLLNNDVAINSNLNKHNHDSRYYTKTESDNKYLGTNITFNGATDWNNVSAGIYYISTLRGANSPKFSQQNQYGTLICYVVKTSWLQVYIANTYIAYRQKYDLNNYSQWSLLAKLS